MKVKYKYSLKAVNPDDIEDISRAKVSFWRELIQDFLKGNNKVVKVEVSGVDSKTILGGLRQYIYSDKYGFKGVVNVIKRGQTVYLIRE